MPILEVSPVGDSTSFAILTKLPLPNGINLYQLGDGWSLTEAGFEPGSHIEMFNRALRLIDWLNAFGAIEEPSYKKISLGSARCGPYQSLASFDATVMFIDKEFLDSNITAAPRLSREIMAF